jgi:DNA-binding transcriptional MerR regulator
MSINTPPKSKRETWRDWLPAEIPSPPDDQLFTRDELLHLLHQGAAHLGNPSGSQFSNDLATRVALTTNELRYLESEGVLPRPIRRWHKGAVRALYPVWVVHLVTHIRGLQLSGFALAEIRPWAREHIAAIARGEPVTDRPTQTSSPTHTSPTALPVTVRRELRRLARAHERVVGVETARVEVRVTSITGHTTTYEVPLTDDETPGLWERAASTEKFGEVLQ